MLAGLFLGGLSHHAGPRRVMLATLAVCAVLAAANYTVGYVDGTLPVLPVPQVAAPRMSGNQFILNFPTVVGQTYQVLYKDNLTDATWTPVGDPIPGTGGSITVTNAISGSQRFFEVGITPAN